MACQKEPCAHVASAIKYATIAISVIGLWLSWFSMKVLENENRQIRIEEKQKNVIQRQQEIINRIKEREKYWHESIKTKRNRNSDSLCSD